MKNVAYLLGAGFSIPAGYSSTGDLTKKIQTRRSYFLHTDKRFWRGSGPFEKSEMDVETSMVFRISEWLFDQAQEYFRRRCKAKVISYEDVYHLASQLKDDATELQNPALLPFLDRVGCEWRSWPEYVDWCTIRGGDIHTLFETVCHYIEDVVANELLYHKPDQYFKHLELIEAADNATDIKLKGIATLAHDTHVETDLRSRKIKLADGFGDSETDCGWRTWEDCFPASGGVPFLKLHGSVDWKRLRCYRNAFYPLEEIGVCCRTEQQRKEPRDDARTCNEVYEVAGNNRPLLLIGTFNKPARYSRHIMLDIHYRFRKVLEASNTLVICGYSFGDKAINTQIIDWWRPKYSLVVIDCNDKKKVIKSARFAIRKYLCCRVTTRFITKSMEEVCPNELMDELRKPVSE